MPYISRHACRLSCSVGSDSETLWTVASQAPSVEYFRQEYWSGLPFSSSRGSSQPWGSNPCLLRFLHCRRILYSVTSSTYTQTTLIIAVGWLRAWRPKHLEYCLTQLGKKLFQILKCILFFTYSTLHTLLYT